MKTFQKEFDESEERFGLLINSVTDYAIFMLDPNGVVTSWNVGATRLTQYSKEEILGEHFSIFYPSEERDNIPAKELAAALNDCRFETEGWRIRKDGSRYWANVVITPVYDATQTHLGFAKVTRDLTTRRQAEQHLRESEERLNLMVTSVQDYAIFMLSPTGIIETWNVGAERLKGYRPNEIIGKHFSTFYLPYERLTKPPMELETATREGRYEEEGWRLRKDGTTFWANVVITALISATGELRGFSKVTRDLTARREAEEALRQSEERLSLMVNSVQDYAIFMLDPNGYIQSWNLGAERMKGYTQQEAIGRHFSMFYSDDERETKPPMELKVAAAVGRYEEEGWRIRKDGTRFIANVVITALYGPDKQLRGFSKVTRDMTDRRKAEEARLKFEQERIARTEAERANRVKDEFLAVVSHELRTPLTPIIGWSKVLQSQRLMPEQIKALKIIERNAYSQVKLIEDLLDIGSIVYGKIKLDMKSVGLAQVIEAAIDAVQPVAQAKNIKIQFILDESVGPVSGDVLRLQQIFWNLLTNAVKFSQEQGKIEVRAGRVDNHARIVIKDNGAGISTDYLPHVFERFSQFDSSSSRKHGGLGIGLYVVRQLTQLHGGTVRVESEGLGKGASFIVEMPIPEVQLQESAYPAESIDPLSNTALLGKTVLVVDDEPDARNFLAYALRECGAGVIIASSTKEALAKLSLGKFDVLVSDIGMPGEDGYHLIRQLRAQGLNLPAIAVTAFARSEDALRAMQAGYQRHMSKPVNPHELCSVVAALAT